MIVQRMQERSREASQWLERRLQKDGSYEGAPKDLSCYYKSPALFAISGKIAHADSLLNFIQSQFMQADGDFKTDANCKSSQAALAAYWPYMNGWITLAAQRLGRFDIAYPAYHYLHSFYLPTSGGGTSQFPPTATSEMDGLTTAHLGLIALYFGESQKATKAGDALIKLLDLQPDKRKGFYLRMKEGKIIQEFSPHQAFFYLVSTQDSNQAYFMIGYPMAFLGKLYQATGDHIYLRAAERYVEFALNCQGNIDSFHYSHKVAWGASLIAMLAKNQRYQDLADRIASYLMSTQQSDGCWFAKDAVETMFDQTAEIAIWLNEMTVQRYLAPSVVQALAL